MFGIKKLKARITALEEKMRGREIKENCAAGVHVAEMVGSKLTEGKPWVRCKHCYVTLSEKKNEQ